MLEREPVAGAVGVEPRDVERTVVEEIAVRRAVRGIPRARGHELVDVLEPFVVAHVEGDPPVRADRRVRAFVLDPPERGALHRLRLRRIRIDLDHPAEAVRLVRMARGVEALVGRLPAIAAPLADAVAPLLGRDRAGVHEVEVPVLLAGKVGPPRRVAVRAAVVGAEHLPAGRIECGLHRLGPGGGAGDPAGRVGGDAPRVAGGPHDFPAAASEAHLDHRHADRGLRFPHLLRAPGAAAVGMQQPVVQVLVVHREEPVGGTFRRERQRIELHPVVVHAGLRCLLGCGVGRVHPERRHVARDSDRVAPAVEHDCVVFGRDFQGVVRGRRDPGEPDRDRPRLRPARATRKRQGGRDGGGHSALQEFPPREAGFEDGGKRSGGRTFRHGAAVPWLGAPRGFGGS